MEQLYKIAGLTVAMDSFGRTVRQAQPYRHPDAAPPPPDVIVRSDWQALQRRQPHLSDEDCEYLSTGASFYRQLLQHDGLLLHASAVVVEGRAYLFSAPCGTGKSTHTGLWLQTFGGRAFLLNDDKPALRREAGVWYAYGTPWSGKHDRSANCRVPVAGICFLHRAAQNQIAPYGGAAAVFALLEQTARPADAVLRTRLLALCDNLLTEVPVWQMGCNMDPQAAQVSYQAMSAARKDDAR